MRRAPKSIEELAIELVRIRREKLNAKAARNEANNRGHPWFIEDEPNPPCWAIKIEPDGDNLPVSEWCEHCKESNRQHERYLTASRRQGSTLRSLEAAVLRMEAS